LRNDDRVGFGKSFDEFLLKYIATGGVGARLEDGPDFLALVFDTEGTHGLANRSGVMAEIVHDGDAAADAADFHAALDAFEGVERGLDLVIFQTAMAGSGDDAKRVANVEFTEKVEAEFETGHFEFGDSGREHDFFGTPGVVFAEAETFHRAM